MSVKSLKTRLRRAETRKLRRKMKKYRHANLIISRRNPHEIEVKKFLEENTTLRWVPQYTLRKRIFDFFNYYKGIAIEVDGASHLGTEEYDRFRDIYNYECDAIVVLRIRNGSKEDMQNALIIINAETTHNIR